jgi:hypothetical protein
MVIPRKLPIQPSKKYQVIHETEVAWLTDIVVDFSRRAAEIAEKSKKQFIGPAG